jgi:hypothetical protein
METYLAHPRDTRRAGQAIVEFVVALVVVLVLFAGLIQLVSLGVAHTKCMVDARHGAGALAIQALTPFSGAEFVQEVTVGNDGVVYSRDDEHSPGYVGDVYTLLSYAQPADLGGQVPDNLFTLTANSPMPHSIFGLVQGLSTRDVPLIPVVRSLLYDSDTINVESSAWMTWTEGLY